jgi:hypothetical protein
LPDIGADGAVLSDDNRAIRLALYDGYHCIGTVALDPVRVVGLGAELIAAAHRRLSSERAL